MKLEIEFGAVRWCRRASESSKFDDDAADRIDESALAASPSFDPWAKSLGASCLTTEFTLLLPSLAEGHKKRNSRNKITRFINKWWKMFHLYGFNHGNCSQQPRLMHAAKICRYCIEAASGELNQSNCTSKARKGCPRFRIIFQPPPPFLPRCVYHFAGVFILESYWSNAASSLLIA